MIDGKTTEKGMLEVVQWMLNNFMNLSDISEILSKYPAMTDSDNGFAAPEGGMGGGHDFDSGFDDFGGGSDFDMGGEPDMGGGGEEISPPSEPSNSVSS